MIPKILQNNEQVNLSIEYPSWFSRRHPHLVDYAHSLGLDDWTVRRNHRQRYYTLHKDGVTLEMVPRQYIIAGRD